MQQKTALIIVVILGILIIVLAAALLLIPKPTPAPQPLQPTKEQLEISDIVEKITEGTKASDIEKDLDTLSKEEQTLGNIDAELQQMERELKTEGL
jgi:flagellar biosynthesis/type III secretory pathway M-ring protein FliF/YscJ